MELEEVNDDLVKTKPKTKKHTKVKPEKIKPEINTEQAVKTGRNSSKTTKSPKKKTSSTRKKKKTVEDDININIQVQDSVPKKSVKPKTVKAIKTGEELATGSELKPMGRAELSEDKVEVLAENSEKTRVDSLKPIQSQEITETPEKQVKPVDTVLSGAGRVDITQNIDLPLFAIKVRNIVGRINNLTAEIIPNKVIIQGIIHDQIFFVGNDGIVHHLANDVDFSTFLDVPGIQPGMNVQTSAVIKDILFDLAPDGLSIVKQIVLEVFAKVTDTVQLNLELGNGPTLLLNRVVGENSAQTIVESDLTLLTPAVKIDEIIGEIRDITVEIVTDKVIVQGILHKQIFFIDAANMGRHQAEDLPFSFFVDIPGVVPGMDVQVQPRIEAILFNLISATVVNEKAVLEFFVKVTESILQPVTIGNGPLFKVEQFIGENTIQQLSESLITLNTAAIKVREIIARIQNLVTNVIPDKVIVQGIIHKQIFYIGTDNIERHQAEDVPFALFLDLVGVQPGDNINLSTTIEGIFFELLSSTELRQKVIFAITAIATQDVQLNLVIGTGPLFKVEQVIGENTKQLLVVSRELIVPPPIIPIRPIVSSLIADPPVQAIIGTQQFLVQNSFSLPVNAIKIKEIDPAVTGVSIQVIADGVMVEGTLNKTIVFVGTDNIVRSINEQLPFSVLVKIPGVTPPQVANATVIIEDVIFNLNASGTAVNQTVVLKAEVQGQATSGQSTPVVTDVSGPNIVKNQLLVQGLVRTPGGDVFQQFNAITGVSGPGISSITTVTTDILHRVGDSTGAPVTIVTDVQTTEY